MDIEKQRNQNMQSIGERIQEIRIGMMTTLDASGTLVSRPMAALEMDADGSLWFFTDAGSAKSHQLGLINVSFADSRDATFVSISGSGELVHDREMIHELWSPAAEPWFPRGEDDPDLALLRVDVKTAELWDAASSRMIQLIATAAAMVTGTPNIGLVGEHRVVQNTH